MDTPPLSSVDSADIEPYCPKVEEISPVASPQTPRVYDLDHEKCFELYLSTFILRGYYDSFLDTFYVAISKTRTCKYGEVVAPLSDWCDIVEKANAYIASGNNRFEFEHALVRVKAAPDFANPYMWRYLTFRQIAEGSDRMLEFSRADYRHFRCRLPILPKLRAIIMEAQLYSPLRDPLIYDLSRSRKGIILYKADLQFEIFAPPFCSPKGIDAENKEPYIEVRDGDFFLNTKFIVLDQRMCKKIQFLRWLDNKDVINLVDPLDNLLKVAIFRSRDHPPDSDTLAARPTDYITFTDESWEFFEKCIEFFLEFTICEANIDDITLRA